MEPEASFEARAVLAPRRTRAGRLVLLVPALALVGIVWAGLSGPRSGAATAALVEPKAPGAAPVVTPVPRPRYPAQVLGLDVHRLEDMQPARTSTDDVLAIAGWWVPTDITDCPAFAAIYRDGALPYVRGDKDKLAFCVRSGVLSASHPATSVGDRRSDAGLSAVDATVVVGVIMPIDLELTDAGATQVVVLGRFLPSGDACAVPAGCRRKLVVDYVAWSPPED